MTREVPLWDEMQKILDAVNDKILERGKNYWEDGQIKKIILSSDSGFEAQVWGSHEELYDISIITDQNGTLLDYDCSCPYDWDFVCKHLVAVAIAIQKSEYQKKQKFKKESEPSLAEVLRVVDVKKLENFILEYAKRDSWFENALLQELRSVEIEKSDQK